MGKNGVYVYAVLERNSGYVLVRARGSKKYGLVGGRQEKKESKLETFLREGEEEVGAELKRKKIVMQRPYITSQGTLKNKIFYRGQIKNGIKLEIGCEIREAKVVSYKKLKKMENKGKLKQGVFDAIREYRALERG